MAACLGDSPEALDFAEFPVEIGDGLGATDNEGFHLESYFFLDILDLSKDIAVLFIQCLGHRVGEIQASAVFKLEFPFFGGDVLGEFALDSNEVADLGHKDDAEIEVPMLLLCEEG